MLSARTEAHIRYILDPGFRFRILRFHLDSHPSYEFKVSHPDKISIAYSVYSILVLFAVVTLLAGRTFSAELAVPDKIFSLAVTSPLIFCLMSQVFQTFRTEEMCKSTNQWFLLIKETGGIRIHRHGTYRHRLCN